ncbi:MAG TPA: VWA domain-containing protein [Candidatus Dormibacteraeota bacterium]|nr:VWA domain-containing protein [Candidatus Dormibacteraeota bacterium]
MPWLGAVVIAVCPLMGQTPTDSPSIKIKSAVHLVQVDVIAKDKHGHPVPGLEAKDFRLYDDGKPQTIARVSVEGDSSRAGGESTVPEAMDRQNPTIFSNTHPGNAAPTVILFDVLNTPLEDQPSMKKALLRSLNQLKEGTPVALLILGEDLTVVSEFTTSTISLAKAAEGGLHLRPEGLGPPLTARSTGNPIVDKMILKAATQAFRVEDHERLVRTLAVLKLICEQLGRLQGRKSLLWISGGLSTLRESADALEAIDKFNDVNVAVYTVDARGVLLGSGVGAETDDNDLTGPLEAEREGNRGDILSVVATATGGVFYHNTNRLEDALNQALLDRSLVYVLDYYPRHGDWHGKLHKLEVKTSRPGIHVRYRASYRATLPAQPTPQEQQQMVAAIASSPLDFSGIHFSVEVKSGPAADPRFVIHVPVEEVQWSAENGKMVSALQVWFIQKRASGDDLATSDSKSDLRMPMDAYEAAARQGLALASDIKLQASAARVRVLVRDVNAGKIGTVDVPVDSKSLTAPSR